MTKYKLILALFSFPILLSAQYHVEQTGTGFMIMTGGDLVLLDASLANQGFVISSGDSKVIMRGTATIIDSKIGTTGLTQLVDLEIDKANNDVQLSGAITVGRDVIMTQGNLNLNGHDLNLAVGEFDGHIVNESETSRIYGPSGGEIVKQINLNAPINQNPGNIGLAFTSSNNLGTVTIRRRHIPQMLPTGASIERYYDVSSTVPSAASNVSLNLYYLDTELGGIDENQVGVWSDASGTWNNYGLDANNTVGDVVIKSNLNAIGRHTPHLNGSGAQIKVFLQGAYNSSANDMHVNLALNNLVPYAEPYTAMGYTGIQNTGEYHVIPTHTPSMPSPHDIVDWVLVELREVSNPENVALRRVALLRRDGYLTSDATYLKPVVFIGVASGESYHVAVRHRNHLGAMTAQPVTFGL